MKIVLGRPFGITALVALGPGLCLLALVLRLTTGAKLVRYDSAVIGSRFVRIRRFAIPDSAFGDVLRAAHFDRVPLLWEIAAGRVLVLISNVGAEGVAPTRSAGRGRDRWEATLSLAQAVLEGEGETSRSAR